MTPKDELRKWKDAPPSEGVEAETARGLAQLREAPTLSREALAQKERRILDHARRPQRKILATFAELRFPLVVSALATLLLVSGVTLVVLDRPASLFPEKVPVRHLQYDEGAAPTPAPNPAPSLANGSAQTSDEAPEAARRGLQHRQLFEPEGSSQPDSPRFNAKRAENKVAEESRMATSKSEDATAPGELAGAAGAGIARPAIASAARAPAAAAPSAAAPSADKDSSAGEALIAWAEQLASSGRCTEAVGDFSRVLAEAGDGQLAERALFGRARCRLELKLVPDARADLRAYLARFPNGRFAAQTARLLQQ